MMKKVIAYLLCVMLLSALVLPVFAAGTTTVTVIPDRTAVRRGEEITFTVTVESTEACRTVGLYLLYDTQAFELVSGETKLEGALLADFDMDGSFVYLFEQPTVPSGTFCVFTLRVKDTAANQTFRIGGEFSIEGTQLTEGMHSAQVSIGTPGDLNGDGTVNDADVEYLLWHILFPEMYPVDGNVDFNGDGRVNDADVEYLLWHILFPALYPL